MSSTIIAITLVLGLSALHWHTRRHAGWRASDKGRFWTYLGYPLVAFAAYWLTSGSTTATWKWALGSAWILASALAFATGFAALRAVTAEHAKRAVELETIEPATGAIIR